MGLGWHAKDRAWADQQEDCLKTTQCGSYTSHTQAGQAQLDPILTHMHIPLVFTLNANNKIAVIQHKRLLKCHHLLHIVSYKKEWGY